MASDVAQAPQGVMSGAWDTGNGRVTFALWAPWKKSVHLVGDFNNWDASADPMNVDQSGMWCLEKQFDRGEYAYQFVLDGEIYVSDPYARRLRWADGSPEPHALVDVGAQPYGWNDGQFGIKPLNELVIYEAHVGDFSPEGTFQGMIERLDYLADLGVDAIELMPVQEFPGDHSWGYNPAYFFAAESAYGGNEAFKQLVDAAHQRGIGIILDMVFAHTTADGPISRLHPFDQNPYFSSGTNPWGFPSLDHWDDATKRLIRDIQDYWLTEFHIDGFRYDYVEGIRYDGVSGMSFIAWAAKQCKPHAYLIAEDIVQDPAAVVRDTETDCSWHWQFNKMMRAQLYENEYEGNRYGDMAGIARVLSFDGDGYGDNAQPINFIETHDEDRLIRDAQNCNPHIDEAGATRKSMLGAIAVFTAQGVPMLYHGQEFGARAEKTVDVSKIPWEYLDSDAGRALHAHYRTLAYLRHTNGALHTNNFEILHSDEETKTIVFHRWDDHGSVVVVGLNFSPTGQHITLDFPRAGVFHEWLHDYDEHVGEGPVTVDLPSSFGKVWVAQG